MHGIWLLVFVPLAGVVAWRCSGPFLRKIALWAMISASVGLAGWFGYLAIEGTELTGSAYDRVMHSLGVIVGTINLPILQLLLGLAVVVTWPRKFEFRLPTEPSATAESDKCGSEVRC